MINSDSLYLLKYSDTYCYEYMKGKYLNIMLAGFDNVSFVFGCMDKENKHYQTTYMFAGGKTLTFRETCITEVNYMYTHLIRDFILEKEKSFNKANTKRLFSIYTKENLILARYGDSDSVDYRNIRLSKDTKRRLIIEVAREALLKRIKKNGTLNLKLDEDYFNRLF